VSVFAPLPLVGRVLHGSKTSELLDDAVVGLCELEIGGHSLVAMMSPSLRSLLFTVFVRQLFGSNR
jgi:hypothetical protein